MGWHHSHISTVNNFEHYINTRHIFLFLPELVKELDNNPDWIQENECWPNMCPSIHGPYSVKTVKTQAGRYPNVNLNSISLYKGVFIEPLGDKFFRLIASVFSSHLTPHCPLQQRRPTHGVSGWLEVSRKYRGSIHNIWRWCLAPYPSWKRLTTPFAKWHDSFIVS